MRSLDLWLVGSIHAIEEHFWVTIVSVGHVCVPVGKSLSTHLRPSEEICSWKPPRGRIGDASKGIEGISDRFWSSFGLHTAFRSIALGDDDADDA